MAGNKLSLAVFIGICLAVELIAGRFTAASVATWYVGLDKPAWTPPGWVFGPVWTVLYISMGVAAWLVWTRRAEAAVNLPLALFAAQLAVNAAWSGLFFTLRSPGLGLIAIVTLWFLVVATLLAFWLVRPPAGALLLPYLAWLSYAAALNFAIWRLNS
jgi:benzodiazapine receptor